MSEFMTYVPMLLSIILFLSFLTGLIVQVLKGVLYEKIPTNLLACIVGMIVTIMAGVAVWSYFKFQLTGWMVIALVFLSFVVAFTAMFGYDKLIQAIKQAGLMEDTKEKEE